jgi:poly-gamma-glutamate capsule biosynthesis protein CapA/YwtB (metallophosphatase superfamily)
MPNKVEIVVGGDICPTDDTRIFFENNDTDSLLNEVKSVLTSADLLVGNMEFPLTDNCQKAIKTGPILYGKEEYIEFFKAAGFTALGLGNNHIKDCGKRGVLSSLEICKSNGIKTVGAGINERKAKKPLIIERNGLKVGIMAFAEHEFNAAYENEPGANLFDVYTDYDQIESFKKDVDYLIIMYHGGIEYYPYPSPLLQKKCRKMIDKGADYVTCQHSHTIGVEEKHNHGIILYGQGNMIYGYRKYDLDWNEGLLIKINLEGKGEVLDVSIEYIPIKTTRTSNIRPMNKKESESLFLKMLNRCGRLKEDGFIEDNWTKFCESKKSLYLPQLYGKSRIFNKLNRIFNNKLIKLSYSDKNLMITKNIIRCESHNEVISSILNRDK